MYCDVKKVMILLLLISSSIFAANYEHVVEYKSLNGYYEIAFQVFNVDTKGKKKILSSPKLSAVLGTEGFIEVANDKNVVSITCTVIEEKGFLVATYRIVIKENGIEKYNAEHRVKKKRDKI